MLDKSFHKWLWSMNIGESVMTFLRPRRLAETAITIGLLWLIWQSNGEILEFLQTETVIGIPFWVGSTTGITALFLTFSSQFRLAVLLAIAGTASLICVAGFWFFSFFTRSRYSKTPPYLAPSRHR